MTIKISHAHVSGAANNAAYDINPSDWNADLATSMATARLLGRSTTGAGVFEEITIGSGLTLSAGSLTASGGGGYTNLFQADANTLDQRNGANAQSHRVYNFYTDASNYERAVFRYASNVLEIGTEALGTGVNRRIKIVGHQFVLGDGFAGGADGDLALARGGDNAVIYWGNTGSAYMNYSGGTLSLVGMGLAMSGSTSGYNVFRRDNSIQAWSIYSASGDLQVYSAAGGGDRFTLKSDGTLIQRPPATATPPTNGDLVIQATSNTSLAFKFKGSDGTVRTGSITLA